MRKNLRQQERAAKRLYLLQEETRHQLLLSKELEQQQEQLQHRLRELSPISTPQQVLLRPGVQRLYENRFPEPIPFPEQKLRLQPPPDAPTPPSSLSSP